MISTADWNQFSADLFGFNEEVGQQSVTWNHVIANLPRYNEGEPPTTEVRPLKCIVSYNAFRVWPITDETISGNVDKQYCYLLINNAYLTGNGWLTSDNRLAFHPGLDTFEIDGVLFEEAGDTPISPNKTIPLYNILVLKRKTTNTGRTIPV